VKIVKILFRLLFGVCAIVLTISAYVGWDLMHPARQQVAFSPAVVGLGYKPVTFSSRAGNLTLRGWLIESPANRQTIIFSHGYGKNRLQDDVPVLPVVQVLVNHGFNVLLFDLRDCGESDGTQTTLGQYETADLLGAVDYVRSKSELSRKITLYGFSMGAATAIMAASQDAEITAVIADSPYADLKSYLEKNLSVWTNLPAIPFNQSILLIVPPLTGVDIEKVSPVRAVRQLDSRPLLLIHGEADVDVPIENSELLQQAYPAAVLVRVPYARHVKSFATDEERYLQEVILFLDTI